MKVLFTADIHIKLGQKNVPVEWAKNRYNMLFRQLEDYYNSVDMVVLGGDIFDRVPTMDELEVYYDFIYRISKPCIIYSGNHEATKKNKTFLSNLAQVSSRLNKNVRIIDDFESIENMDFIPYNKLKEYSPADIDMHGDILFTHVRGEIPPHVKAEVNLELFTRWKLVVAGDLHSHENSQRNIVYPGSPVTTSFHRNIVDTGFLLVDTVSLEYRQVPLELPQLIRKTIKAGDPIIPSEYHHTIYEVEGDMSELGNMEDNVLVDKKLVRRETDTALILDPKMSLTDEVREYLLYILELEDVSVEEVLQLLHNHMDKLSDYL